MSLITAKKRLAIDVGTFTDVFVFDEETGEILLRKQHPHHRT